MRILTPDSPVRMNHPSSRKVNAISNRVAAWDTWSCSLITVAPEAQMFFGTAQVILRAAPDPVIIRMCICPIAHYPRDYFQRLGKWFHSSSSPSPIED
jgi:hypothetical protein